MGEAIPESFQLLFREHYPAVVRKLASLVSDYAIAEDLAQEVFLRLYRSPPDDISRVGAWLHRVLTNTAYDYLRRESRQRELQRQEQNRYAVENDDAPTNEQIVIEQWEREVVKRVLQKLSDRDREALLLRQQGYSYAEIADKMQVNPKIIGSILMRASARFKKSYLQEEAQSNE